MCDSLRAGKRAVEIRNQMEANMGVVPSGIVISVADMAQMINSIASTPPFSYRQSGVIHERNDKGKPSATRVNGKPGSVLPKELLVHLQEFKGEEREKEVLKAVKAIGKKNDTIVGATSALTLGAPSHPQQISAWGFGGLAAGL